MSITVGAIYKAFPNFNQTDMIKLMNGKTDFDGRSEVSLKSIAEYNGGLAQELSIFTAKKEGRNYTEMLSETKLEVVRKAGAVNEDDGSKKKDNNPIPANIQMDKSVFTIRAEKENSQKNV